MIRLLVVLCVAAVLSGCGAPADPTEDILTVMRRAEADWNAGDLEAYMDCYWRSDALRFAGGGGLRRGWQDVLEAYRKAYPDRESMGVLSFSDLDVTVLAPDTALVVGHWRIERGDEAPHGVYTLLLRRLDAGWRIVHDHTSAAATP
jgi:uncharacterized protein (TIGR02246 family)